MVSDFRYLAMPYMSLWKRVPFALCPLLLWEQLTRERVKGVLRHALNNPGSRRGKSPRCGPFALCRLPVGSGPSLHPCRPPPPPASLRADPVSRQRLIDFHAGPTASLQFSAFQVKSFRCKKANCGDGRVWIGPAENCRRVSAGMRVQGARSSVVGRISVAPSGMGC